MLPRYTMTAEEMVETFTMIPPPTPPRGRAAGIPAVLSRVGIALPFQLLEDTDYRFQLGISSITNNADFVQWRQRCPDVDGTDGAVSGVVVLDDEYTPVAHYSASGPASRPTWLVGVHEDHRRKGLATLAILQWFKAVPWRRLVGWPVNEDVVPAFVRAHEMYIEWELARGTEVPQNVIDSLKGQMTA